jgi:hypothetical protein
MPTMISVNTWLPFSNVLSACYCLDGYYVVLVVRLAVKNREAAKEQILVDMETFAVRRQGKGR